MPSCFAARRRRRIAAGGVLAVIAVFVIVAVTSQARPQDFAFDRVATEGCDVALTFDDGPSPVFTPRVLADLGRYGDHATFFDVGVAAREHPALVLAEVLAGDDVENHTYDHVRLTSLSPAGVTREILLGRMALERAGAPAPRFFRPPFGEGFASRTVARAARSAGERIVGWDLGVEHFVNHLPQPAAVADILARIHPGAIILAHDGRLDRTRTVQALPALLAGLHARGLHVLSVSALLATAPHAHRHLGLTRARRHLVCGPRLGH